MPKKEKQPKQKKQPKQPKQEKPQKKRKGRSVQDFIGVKTFTKYTTNEAGKALVAAGPKAE